MVASGNFCLITRSVGNAITASPTQFVARIITFIQVPSTGECVDEWSLKISAPEEIRLQLPPRRPAFPLPLRPPYSAHPFPSLPRRARLILSLRPIAPVSLRRCIDDGLRMPPYLRSRVSSFSGPSGMHPDYRFHKTHKMAPYPFLPRAIPGPHSRVYGIPKACFVPQTQRIPSAG